MIRNGRRAACFIETRKKEEKLISGQAFNKWVGWNFFQNLINGQALITVGRLEFFLKINKRTCPFIREVKVGEVNKSLF